MRDIGDDEPYLLKSQVNSDAGACCRIERNGRGWPADTSDASAAGRSFDHHPRLSQAVERARPVTRAICDAESTPRSLRQRTIILSGDADGRSISQVLSEGFVMDQHKHR